MENHLETHPHIRARSGRRRWWWVVGIAILLHVIAWMLIKPGFFSAFHRPLADNRPQSQTTGSAPPDAMVVVLIDIEGDEPTEAIPEPQPPRPRARPQDRPSDGIDGDLEDLLGDAPTVATEPGSGSAAVPPRPLEITWPDTDNLDHCLGTHVDVRVRVGVDGTVLEVTPVPAGNPTDCVAAATSAAEQIRFQPGTMGGRATAMWTRVRIDFRRR